MANIKISQLTELNRDQLGNGDMFIVNDENSVTTRLAFGTLTEKIERDNRNFSGAVEFSGAVTVTGSVANRDFYTKSETQFEIANAIDPVQVQLNNLETDFGSMVTLTGQPKGAQTILGGTFSSGSQNMYLNGPYNITTAMIQLDKGYMINRDRLNTVDEIQLLHSARLDALDMNAPDMPDGRVTVNEKAIADLYSIVGVDGSNINQNGSDISANQTTISNIISQLGTSAADTVITTHLSGTNYLTTQTTFVSSLVELDSRAKSARDRADSAFQSAAQAELGVSKNSVGINAVWTAVKEACEVFAADGTQTTADQLATAIAQALIDVANDLPS